MRAIIAYVAFAAVASGLPARPNGGKFKTHQSTKDILEYIQGIFEKTCHNLCLQKFPEAGTEQDLCMSICRASPPMTPNSFFRF